MLSLFVDFSNLVLCYFLPQSFSVVRVNCDNRGRIQINEFERHSLALPFSSDWSAAFGKYVFVLFCSLPFKSWCHKFFEISLAATKTVLKPVSCDHLTSFNYDCKNTRDVDLTCWCNLSNIMSDSIFHEIMRQEITVFFLFFCFVLFCFFFRGVIPLLCSRWKRWNQFYHYIISGRGETLNHNELWQMGLISLQWDLKAKTCQGISD